MRQGVVNTTSLYQRNGDRFGNVFALLMLIAHSLESKEVIACFLHVNILLDCFIIS